MREAILVGLRNTITVALVGIVLTLILGTLVGIARLSGNWLLRRVAGAYVEALRNVPPLLVIVFVNSAALATLPPIEDATRSAACWSCRCPSSASWPVAGDGVRRACTWRCWRWPGGGRGGAERWRDGG